MFAGLKAFWRQFVQDYKAAQRGEMRVSPALRGRVYARQTDLPATPFTRAHSPRRVVMRPSRVYSRQEDRWFTPDEWRAKFGG